MVSSLLIDIGLIILFAAFLALIVKFFRQPLVLGYVLAGILIGPLAFGLITNAELIKQLAELGVAFLLFIVGLELDISKFKQLGWVVGIVGVLQVILVTFVATLIATIWLNTTEALYVGLIVAFSSTMLVVKLMEDKNELQTLHGKIVLGILLVQDILVVLALSLLQGIGNSSFFALISLVKGLGLILVSYLIGKYIFNYVLRLTASLPELLFVVALAISFTYAALAYYLGFSIVIGAFIAGVALASSPYSFEIVGRLILLLLIIIIKPFIIFWLLKSFKQSNRTCFSTSLSLAQISEFSLVLAGSGVASGHLSQGVFSLVIIIGAITFTLTSYLIKYDRGIYSIFYPILKKIETNPKNFNIERLEKEMSNHIIIIGAHRMASRIIETLKLKRKDFVVLDFNPERVKQLMNEGINCIYGDYGNIHVLEILNIKKAKMLISTVQNLHDNIRLVKIAKFANKNLITIINTHSAMDALLLYREGVDFFIFPEYLAGQKVADYLTHLDAKGIKKWGKNYREKLVDEIRKNRLFM